MKTFLGVFLIMFMVVTSSGVLSGFMTVVEAQNLHAQIINELEDSDYDSSVAQTCFENCLLYTSPSPRDGATSRMPSSA